MDHIKTQISLHLVEQELLTLAEHMSSPLVLSRARITQSLVLCVYFVDRCLFFSFWSLCCLFLFYIRILITLWYLQTCF
jgi:hypothetical protein